MSKNNGTHPTLFLVPTSFACHPVVLEAVNHFGSIKSGRGLIFLDQKTFEIIQLSILTSFSAIRFQ